MVTGIGAWICIILFVIVISAPLWIFILVEANKKITYQVTYKTIGFYVDTYTIYIKAKGLADLQQKLEEKHFPLIIHMTSVKEIV